ncbi:MAG: hypothetical protein K9G76_00650 [Bacteroidales bacterium]|nr:hypothetical protein [Bacteroidales bacterium]MCF8402622.1 hypothetical protein [Bacteroidales bacterium]
MEKVRKIWAFILFDTYGNIALASFLICIISGFILAIPYDVQNAYESIALMLITNLPAVIFRNMHYWSAQFFLVFTLLHTYEHLKIKSAANVSGGVWAKLVLSVLIVFFVMLSGFILKADADSLQAKRILESLISDIPVLGKLLAGLFYGKSDSLQVLYVHHIATGTILLIFIIIEHARVIWSKRNTLLLTLAILTLLSFFVHAPLHDSINPILKGPWYFVGLQEIIHWMSKPGWIWVFIFLFLIFLFLLKYANEKSTRIALKTILSLSLVYLILTVIGFYFRGENWGWKNPWESTFWKVQMIPESGIKIIDSRFANLTSMDIPVVNGKREACINCHTNLTGFSPSHNPEAIGCTSCHLGNPFTLDKKKAHKGMVLIPGNLTDASFTCGTADCHAGIPERINNSLMTTNSGLVSVDRFVFGEAHSPDILAHIEDIGFSAADKHLRDLCANCHLGNEKMETGPIDQLSRGGGCNACHLSYSDEGIRQHLAYQTSGKKEKHLPQIHPSLDIQINNDHCFGCHSRSGRIATNYEGWHETLLNQEDVEGDSNYRVLQDLRVSKFIKADVHHLAGLDCIDCHNSYEVMGDGNLYAHEEQAVKVRCEDCHFNAEPNTLTYAQLDAESKKIVDLRKFAYADRKMMRASESGFALINTYLENDSAFMVGKNTGKIHPMNPPATVCMKDQVHESLTCSSCHTAWAPQCIGCHNEFDRNAEGFDLLDNKFVKGEWVEYVGSFFAEPPTLGVRENEIKRVEPAIPGMVLTIDRKSYSPEDSTIFHRLYAPCAPHTTSIVGRNCKSCHNNPLALGYGRGELTYEVKNENGKWKFTPQFAPNKYDGLPEDAWIGFLRESSDDSKPAQRAGGSSDESLSSTRTDFRPFNLEEQKRILTVGACLTCHNDDSEIIRKSLDEEFKTYLGKLSDKCILPDFN